MFRDAMGLCATSNTPPARRTCKLLDQCFDDSATRRATAEVYTIPIHALVCNLAWRSARCEAPRLLIVVSDTLPDVFPYSLGDSTIYSVLFDYLDYALCVPCLLSACLIHMRFWSFSTSVAPQIHSACQTFCPGLHQGKIPQLTSGLCCAIWLSL